MENTAKKDTTPLMQAAYKRVMKPKRKVEQNEAARALMEFKLGWKAHEAYVNAQAG